MEIIGKDKKRMIDVFFDGDKEKTSADIREALDETNESDMSMDELQKLYDLYSFEAEGKFATQPFMDDVLAENQDGKLVSMYYGQDAIDMQRNFRENQAKADEFVLEQKIKRLREDTI